MTIKQVKAAGIGLVTLLILGGVFWSGWEWRDRSADAAAAAFQAELNELSVTASERARALEQLQAKAVADAREIDHLRDLQRAAVNRELVLEVNEYVPPEVPANCPIGPDTDWVRIHDRNAAPGRVPSATNSSSGPYGSSARELTDADTLGVIQVNYQTYREVRDQLKALQDWVRATAEQGGP